jgi:hypothetical protein
MIPLMKFLRANVLELSYLTEKRTLIRDWRLALLYYALIGLVLAYVGITLINGKSYIMTEVPTGVSTAWGKRHFLYDGTLSDDGLKFYASQKTAKGKENCVPLTDGNCTLLEDYKFNYSASYVYNNITFGYFNAEEMISKLPNGNVLFFATHVHQSLVARYEATNTTNGTYTCTNATIKENFDEADAIIIEGRCTHMKEYNYFVPGMEECTLAFDHSYDTTSGMYAGTKPKTYVQKKDSDVNKFEFAPGDSVSLTMKEWLDLAGVDLDKPFDEQPRNFTGTLEGLTGAGADSTETTPVNSTGKYPYPRLTGVRLNILVRYFNYDLHKEVHTDVGDDSVYAIVTVSPVLGWFSKGQEITYRSKTDDLNDPINATDGQPRGYYQDMYKYGILFDIQQNGLVGQLDPVFIILTLTSGLVLLGVAGTIVSLMAKFGMGELSKTYKSFIQEECDIQLEAARYTAQSIVASRVFKVADKDGGGQLDFQELKEVVTSCFSDQFAGDSGKGKLQKELFSEEEIHSMTLFLMRAVDPYLSDRIMEGNEKTIAELENSSISLNQWQELSTSDYIDHGSLKQIIARNKTIKKLTMQQ